MKTIESKQGIKGMLFVFVLLACFQNVQLLSISEYAALKPVHLFSLLFLPLLFRKKEVKINRILLVYLAYLVVVSLANLQKFGLHSLLLNYLFGLYIVVLCANCGEVLSQDDWLGIICGAASILIIAVLVKMLSAMRTLSGTLKIQIRATRMYGLLLAAASIWNLLGWGCSPFSSTKAAGSGCMRGRICCCPFCMEADAV